MSNQAPAVDHGRIHRTHMLLGAIRNEMARAEAKFAPFNSAHEGFAVLLEEVDELWHEVKHGTPERAREEAEQVAAMALRFILDTADRSAK